MKKTLQNSVEEARFELIEGVTIEIKTFFDDLVFSSSNIFLSYNFDKEQTLRRKIYTIDIEIAHIDLQNVQHAFMNFVRFVAYHDFVCFRREVDLEGQSVDYAFMTSTSEKNLGFSCNLHFYVA